MTRNRDIPLRTISRHCEELSCRKCRARFHWYRRKSWQVNKVNRKFDRRK